MTKRERNVFPTLSFSFSSFYTESLGSLDVLVYEQRKEQKHAQIRTCTHALRKVAPAGTRMCVIASYCFCRVCKSNESVPSDVLCC